MDEAWNPAAGQEAPRRVEEAGPAGRRKASEARETDDSPAVHRLDSDGTIEATR
jgi:hypothetical protein